MNFVIPIMVIPILVCYFRVCCLIIIVVLYQISYFGSDYLQVFFVWSVTDSV